MSDLQVALQQLQTRLRGNVSNQLTRDCLGAIERAQRLLVKDSDRLYIRVTPAGVPRKDLKLAATLSATEPALDDPTESMAANQVSRLAESKIINLKALRQALRDLEAELKSSPPTITPGILIETWEVR